MSFAGIQIISLLFIFFMMYVVHIHYRKQELPITETIFWFTSLVILAIIVIVPNTARFVTQTFSVNRLMDFIVIVGFMITLYMLIDNRIQIQKLRKQLEEKVRDKAITKACEDETS